MANFFDAKNIKDWSSFPICSLFQNYADPYNVRNCYLVGLNDLDGAQSYVQDVQAAYMNDLIDIGVAGNIKLNPLLSGDSILSQNI